MRKFYKKQRNEVISRIRSWEYGEKLTIYEQNAGLHFILKVDTELTDEQLGRIFSFPSGAVRCLTDYYHGKRHGDLHCLVVNYAEIREDSMEKGLQALGEVLKTQREEKN